MNLSIVDSSVVQPNETRYDALHHGLGLARTVPQRRRPKTRAARRGRA